jgi:hypothetical protein
LGQKSEPESALVSGAATLTVALRHFEAIVRPHSRAAGPRFGFNDPGLTIAAIAAPSG